MERRNRSQIGHYTRIHGDDERSDAVIKHLDRVRDRAQRSAKRVFREPLDTLEAARRHVEGMKQFHQAGVSRLPERALLGDNDADGLIARLSERLRRVRERGGVESALGDAPSALRRELRRIEDDLERLPDAVRAQLGEAADDPRRRNAVLLGAVEAASILESVERLVGLSQLRPAVPEPEHALVRHGDPGSLRASTRSLLRRVMHLDGEVPDDVDQAAAVSASRDRALHHLASNLRRFAELTTGPVDEPTVSPGLFPYRPNNLGARPMLLNPRERGETLSDEHVRLLAGRADSAADAPRDPSDEERWGQWDRLHDRIEERIVLNEREQEQSMRAAQLELARARMDAEDRLGAMPADDEQRRTLEARLDAVKAEIRANDERRRELDRRRISAPGDADEPDDGPPAGPAQTTPPPRLPQGGPGGGAAPRRPSESDAVREASEPNVRERGGGRTAGPRALRRPTAVTGGLPKRHTHERDAAPEPARRTSEPSVDAERPTVKRPGRRGAIGR